jgi:hypothetical protein
MARNARNTRHAAGRVRYAVIGPGYIHQVAVLSSFAHARRNSELVALFSDDPEKLRRLSRKEGFVSKPNVPGGLLREIARVLKR